MPCTNGREGRNWFSTEPITIFALDYRLYFQFGRDKSGGPTPDTGDSRRA